MSSVKAIPNTHELISKIKLHRHKNIFDRIESYAFKAILLLFVCGIGVAIWKTLVTTSAPAITFSALLITLLSLLIVFVWGTSQIVEMIIALKAGFKPLTDEIDRRMEQEREMIRELAICNPIELRERAKHLELEAKFKTRRAAIGVAAVAVVVAIRQWLESAIKTGYLPQWMDVSFFLNSGAIGFSIGSVIIAIFAGRLERVSGVLSLAADRSGK